MPPFSHSNHDDRIDPKADVWTVFGAVRRHQRAGGGSSERQAMGMVNSSGQLPRTRALILAMRFDVAHCMTEISKVAQEAELI
jgi:hypothetical protein